MPTDRISIPIRGKMGQPARMAGLLVAVLCLAACGASSNGPSGEFRGATERISNNGSDVVGSIPSGRSAELRAPSQYKAGPLDVLNITVFQVSDLDRKVQVAGDGFISLPLIGQVRASGRTAQQIEDDIAARLRARYLRSPQVSVFIEEYNSQKVTVGGSVKQPGVFPLKGDMTLLEGIARAQGMDNVADPTNVVVFRTVNNRRYVAHFDVKEIREGRATDPILVDGDVVEVDTSGVKVGLRDWSPAFGALTGVSSVLTATKVVP